MKTKKLSIRFSLVLLSALFLSNSFAQKNFTDASAYRVPFNPSIVFPSPENNLSNKKDVNKKVLKHFNKAFRNAENIRWRKLDNNFLAMFTKGDITTKSLFDKKGPLIYSIDYFLVKELPDDIRNIVINNYRQYAVTSVVRVQQDSQKIWIVKLADKANYVAVRIENGEMQEVENFQKAN
jgi:hypothetical protein